MAKYRISKAGEVYKVKGKTKSRRKTYSSKALAKKARKRLPRRRRKKK